MSTNASSSGPALEVDGLSVGYRRKHLVLQELTLAVPRGCVYALLGRNGAGKSSLLRVLLGERPPVAGRVRLLGEDPWKRRAALMERVGFVPEQPNAPPEMTARQLVDFCARLYRQFDRSLVAERLAHFEIPVSQPFGSLSKGQKAAVMLSLALGPAPELLLLDDPTLGLDVVARDAVFREVIAELADHGTTVFVTTHDLRAIEAVADRVGILSAGRLALESDLEPLKLAWERPLEEIFTAVTGGQTAPSAPSPAAEVRS